MLEHNQRSIINRYQNCFLEISLKKNHLLINLHLRIKSIAKKIIDVI